MQPVVRTFLCIQGTYEGDLRGKLLMHSIGYRLNPVLFLLYIDSKREMEDMSRIQGRNFVMLRAVKDKNPVAGVRDGGRKQFHNRRIHGPAQVGQFENLAHLA